MTREELYKIAKRYAQDELKDSHSAVEDVVAAAFLDGIDYAGHHPHWISVEDELPEDGIRVVAVNKDGAQDIRFRYHGKWYSNFGNEYTDVTSWYPFPETPVPSNLENTGKNEKGE